MIWLVDPILMAIILLNFLVLGSSRLRAAIRFVGIQGVLLGLLPLLVHDVLRWHAVAVSIGAVLLKGVLIPRTLEAGLGTARPPREQHPFVGYIASLLVGSSATGLAVVFAQSLPLAEEHATMLVVPAALSSVLTGFWILTVRRRAVAHVLGILVLENGVFTFGLLLLDALPSLVEAGVLLDIFVAVFIMAILLKHIDQTLATARAESMTILREE